MNHYLNVAVMASALLLLHPELASAAQAYAASAQSAFPTDIANRGPDGAVVPISVLLLGTLIGGYWATRRSS